MSRTHRMESVVSQDGGQEILAQSYTLCPAEGQEFLICLDSNEKDEISTAIAGGTYGFPAEFYLLKELAAPGQRVLDLGAHIGTFSLFAAALGYRVLSVEASPRNAALLQHSALKNNFSALQVVSTAVGDHVGRLEFVQAGPYGLVANPNISNPTISVPVITVDKLLEDVGWDSVDFVKMDVEGSEVAALRGMSRLLTREDAPPILYESNAHTLGLFDETPAHLMALLDDYGYRCYLVDGSRLVCFESDGLQVEVCVNYLATKRPLGDALGSWPIVPLLSFQEQIVKILSSSVVPSAHARAHVARALSIAGAETLSDPRVVNALCVLKTDDEPSVRSAMAWWQQGEPGPSQPGLPPQMDGAGGQQDPSRAQAHRRYLHTLKRDLGAVRSVLWRDQPVRAAIALFRRALYAGWIRLKRWTNRV